MNDPSTRVVLAALAGNGAVALAKFIAAGFSGSAAMLTEAIHSLVDTGDQILLLVGQKRSTKPPDASHPLGYGMEAYFWSFIVALMVFLMGGVLSLYEGIRHVLRPAPLTSLWISLGVLAAAAVFEGASFVVGFRQFRRVVRGRGTSLWSFIKASKDPALFSVLLEDAAALAGLVLAAAGILGSTLFHLAWADGVASIGIGLLLIFVAFVLANETRSLIAGEAVAPPVMEKVRSILADDRRIAKIEEIATLHLGPQAILVALTVDFQGGPDTTTSSTIGDITTALQGSDERIERVYFRPVASAQA